MSENAGAEEQYRATLRFLRGLPEEAVSQQGAVHIQKAVENLEYVVENEFGLVCAKDSATYRCEECDRDVEASSRPSYCPACDRWGVEWEVVL